MRTQPGPSVVITGATKGLGRGLALAFLARGCHVTFCGRSEASVRSTEAELSQEAEGRVLGVVADIARHEDLQALWDVAALRAGRVDV